MQQLEGLWQYAISAIVGGAFSFGLLKFFGGRELKRFDDIVESVRLLTINKADRAELMNLGDAIREDMAQNAAEAKHDRGEMFNAIRLAVEESSNRYSDLQKDVGSNLQTVAGKLGKLEGTLEGIERELSRRAS